MHFLNENVWISIDISLKFVPKDQITNIPPLIQIYLIFSLLTPICVTRPRLVKFLLCLPRLLFVTFVPAYIPIWQHGRYELSGTVQTKVAITENWQSSWCEFKKINNTKQKTCRLLASNIWNIFAAGSIPWVLHVFAMKENLRIQCCECIK